LTATHFLLDQCRHSSRRPDLTAGRALRWGVWGAPGAHDPVRYAVGARLVAALLLGVTTVLVPKAAALAHDLGEPVDLVGLRDGRVEDELVEAELAEGVDRAGDRLG
jgi:hypothetical protein